MKKIQKLIALVLLLFLLAQSFVIVNAAADSWTTFRADAHD